MKMWPFDIIDIFNVYILVLNDQIISNLKHDASILICKHDY